MRKINYNSDRIPLQVLALLLAGFALSGGCAMVGPDFHAPQAELPEQWNDAGPVVLEKQQAD